MQSLPDPKNDRVVKTVKPPPNKPLTSEMLWDDVERPSKLIRKTKLEIVTRPPQKRR